MQATRKGGDGGLIVAEATFTGSAVVVVWLLLFYDWVELCELQKNDRAKLLLASSQVVQSHGGPDLIIALNLGYCHGFLGKSTGYANLLEPGTPL